MSIEKLDSLKITKQNIPFTQVSNNVIQNTTYPLAAFIWIYLLSKPAGWTVVKAEIKSHFKISDQTLKKVFAYLNRCHLIEYHFSRQEKNQFKKTEIHVLCGDLFTEEDNKKQKVKKLSTAEKASGRVSHPVALPPGGKERAIKKDKDINKDKSYKQWFQNKKSKAPLAPVENQSTSYREDNFVHKPLSQKAEAARQTALKAAGVNFSCNEKKILLS